MEAPSFDDLMCRLSALSVPFTVTSVEGALDLAFIMDAGMSGPQIDVWVGRPRRPGGILRLAELRFFKRNAEEAVLGLQLTKDAGISLDEVDHCFGQSDEMGVEVEGTAIYYTYHRDWGDLVFAFTPDGSALREIVLSTEPAPVVRR